jgi:cell division protein ZapA
MKKSSKQTIEVTLLGKEYLVRTDAEEDVARQIADYVNEKIDETRKNTDTVSALNLLLLTALNIAEEYFTVKTNREALLTNLEERSEDLIRAIEAEIP